MPRASASRTAWTRVFWCSTNTPTRTDWLAAKNWALPTAASDMSFSVQVPGAGALGAGRLEWSGSSLATVFAQRRNLLRPALSGHVDSSCCASTACAPALAAAPMKTTALAQPLGEFLDQHGFGAAFRDWYFLPDAGLHLELPHGPDAALSRGHDDPLCHNHGLIQVTEPAPVVHGGGRLRASTSKPSCRAGRRGLNNARERIQRNAAGVLVQTSAGSEHFDAVVLAMHSDQALAPAGPAQRWNSRCWAPSATSPTAPCCTPTPRVMPSAVPPGPRGTTSAQASERTGISRASACTIGSTTCSRCPLRSPVLVSLEPLAQHYPTPDAG